MSERCSQSHTAPEHQKYTERHSPVNPSVAGQYAEWYRRQGEHKREKRTSKEFVLEPKGGVVPYTVNTTVLGAAGGGRRAKYTVFFGDTERASLLVPRHTRTMNVQSQALYTYAVLVCISLFFVSYF